MADDRASAPVPYMERTRNYYRALGYENDYVWAHHHDVPFARLQKPLSELTIGLIMTASPADGSNRGADQRRKVWSGTVIDAPEMFMTDLAWDRESTHTDDRETFLPIDAINRLVADGTIGALAPRFHGAATDYSHRKTTDEDAPALLRRLFEDRVDAAVLTAL